MTRYQFLMSTVNYYGENPSRRAQKPGQLSCYYRLNGNKCAVGREIPDDKYDPNMEIWQLPDVIRVGAPHLQPLGLDFVTDVQSLHDYEGNWHNSTGLSKEGNRRFCHLVNRYLL